MKTNTKPVAMNDNLNECCVRTFEEFIEDKTLPAGKSIFYDLLTKHNYFELTVNEKKKTFKEAQEFLQEIENKKPKNKQRNFLNNTRSLSVVFKAKTLALEKYFRHLQFEGVHLKEILIKQ